MGALAEVLRKRFKLDAEVLPRPGTAELQGMFLVPGKTAGVCVHPPGAGDVCCRRQCRHG